MTSIGCEVAKNATKIGFCNALVDKGVGKTKTEAAFQHFETAFLRVEVPLQKSEVLPPINSFNCSVLKALIRSAPREPSITDRMKTGLERFRKIPFIIIISAGAEIEKFFVSLRQY